jgi:transcriptional regulator GlxA family with amidase domain
MAWLAAHAARQETDILSICTGILVCGEAGLLKGKKACGPRGLQDELAKRFDGVEWVGDELRWTRDGNIWSSGKQLGEPPSCSCHLTDRDGPRRRHHRQRFGRSVC